MAAPSTHRCAAQGCQHLVSTRMLMCMDHWRMVPVATRREVTAAWKRWLKANDWQERHDARCDMNKAQAKAVDEVAAKQLRRAAAADERTPRLI